MTLSRREFVATASFSLASATSGTCAWRDGKMDHAGKYSSWGAVRDEFDLAPGWLHFSQFFLVSHPRPVRESIERYRRLLDANPLLTVEHGTYLGVRPEELALTDSTTQGLALIYIGLKLDAEDEILTTTHEHFVHHEAIRLASERNGASMRRISLYDDPAEASAEQMVDRLRRGIAPRTRVVGLTWVHSSTGVKLPVRALAQAIADVNRNRGERDRVLLVLDGVHGLGTQDENLHALGCDFFAAGTHKWIFAPRGTGIIWAPEKNWSLLRPTIPTFYSIDPFLAWENGQPPSTL